MSLLGFQFWPNVDGAGDAVEFVRRHRPTIVKVLDPFSNDALIRDLRAASPDTIIVWRFVGFFDDRAHVLGRPMLEVRDAARAHFNELRSFLIPRKDLFDILELFNEPGDANLETLIAYTEAFAESAAAEGIRIASFCFSTGTPREEYWDRLKKLQLQHRVIFAPHEYAAQNDPQWGWHMLRFPRWMPDSLFYIGETGQEPGGIARWGSDAFRRLMAEYDRRLKEFPNCLGAAIFAWNGQKFGWGDYSIWPSLVPWLSEYLAAHPPIHRRHLLDAAPSPSPSPLPSSPMVRAIDCSEFSGEMDAETLQALQRLGIRAAIVGAIHGLGGGRRGWNRHLFAQMEALEGAGIRILGAYIWPPDMAREGWVRRALRAAFPQGTTVFLDVESGRWRASELWKFASLIQEAGFRAGIYSGPGAWVSSVALSSVEDSRALRNLSDLPFWEANYPRKFRDAIGRWNGKWPSEVDDPWRPATQGPWTFSPLWQFVGTTRIGNRVFDLNVAHAAFWGL